MVKEIMDVGTERRMWQFVMYIEKKLRSRFLLPFYVLIIIDN